MCPRPDAIPVHATISPVFPGKSFIRIESMAPMAAASAAPPMILSLKMIFFKSFTFIFGTAN